MLNINDRICHVTSHEWGEVRGIDDVTGLAIVLWDCGEQTLTESMELNRVVTGQVA